MSYFEEMDDIEFGAQLFESEMGTEMNEEEAYMQRCIIKGKRAKSVKTQKLLWYRKHRIEAHYDPNAMNIQKYKARLSSVKARNDMLVFSQRLKCMSVEEYEDADVIPAKHRKLIDDKIIA